MILLRFSIVLLAAVPAFPGLFMGGPGSPGNIGAGVFSNRIHVTPPAGFASASRGGGWAIVSSNGASEVGYIGQSPCLGVLCGSLGGPPIGHAGGEVNAAQGSIRASATASGFDTGAEAWLGFDDLIVFGTPTLNITLDINSLFAVGPEGSAEVEFIVGLNDLSNEIFNSLGVGGSGPWTVDLTPYTSGSPLTPLHLYFSLRATATCGFDAGCLAVARADQSLYLQIPGNYTSAGGFVYAGPPAASAVPEPGSILLVGAGLGAVALRRRRVSR